MREALAADAKERKGKIAKLICPIHNQHPQIFDENGIDFKVRCCCDELNQLISNIS